MIAHFAVVDICSIPCWRESHLHVSTNSYLASEITFNNYCNAEIQREIHLDKSTLGTLKSAGI